MSEVSNDARCKRTLRICAKITDLLNREIEGDMDEFLSNIQSIFLILSEYLHIDIDHLEISGGESIHVDLYDHAHAKVEEMYDELCYTIAKIQKSLACEDQFAWFNELNFKELDDLTCAESEDTSCLLTVEDKKKVPPECQEIVRRSNLRVKENFELPLSCS